MLGAIEKRFEGNVRRVRNIVDVYDQLTPGGRGRRDVSSIDLLRAAVVLLHASLEDLLRSLAEWKLPTASPDALESIPLAGTSDPRRTRFSVAELARHRGRAVDEVIEDSVTFHLERSNYNNPGEIKTVVEMCGGDSSIVNSFARWMGPMMQRRHWIAHRADRNSTMGRGHHEARSLSRGTVMTWIDQTEQMAREILKEFR